MQFPKTTYSIFKKVSLHIDLLVVILTYLQDGCYEVYYVYILVILYRFKLYIYVHLFLKFMKTIDCIFKKVSLHIDLLVVIITYLQDGCYEVYYVYILVILYRFKFYQYVHLILKSVKIALTYR